MNPGACSALFVCFSSLDEFLKKMRFDFFGRSETLKNVVEKGAKTTNALGCLQFIFAAFSNVCF